MTKTIPAVQLWIIASLLTTSVLTQSSQGQMAQEVTLQLESNGPGVNQFEISSSVNTLVPSLGTLSDVTSVDLIGDVRASLVLETSSGGSDIAVTGIRLEGGGLVQTAFSSVYPVPPMGNIEFHTTDLDGHLFTSDTIYTPVINGQFSIDLVQLIQNRGLATVGVPTKPPAIQDLGSDPVNGSFNYEIDSTQRPMGTVDLTLESIQSGMATYQVDLMLPLAGQSLVFEETGLPVTVTYLDGSMMASGSFEVPIIPEPTSLMLSILVAGWCLAACARRRRK